MTTRSAVMPPEAAAWVLAKHPKLVDILERDGRRLLSEGKNERIARALMHTVEEVRAAGRDFLASLQETAIAQLAGGDQSAEPVPVSVSVHAAAEQLELGVRMVGKLVEQGRLERVGRGWIDAVSLALELSRRAVGEDPRAETG